MLSASGTLKLDQSLELPKRFSKIQIQIWGPTLDLPKQTLRKIQKQFSTFKRLPRYFYCRSANLSSTHLSQSLALSLEKGWRGRVMIPSVLALTEERKKRLTCQDSHLN